MEFFKLNFFKKIFLLFLSPNLGSAVLFLILILIICLQFSFWRGPLSFSNMRKQAEQVKILEKQNALLQLRNQNLLTQIQGLKNNAEATETAAREDLGLVKPEEIFYRFYQNKK